MADEPDRFHDFLAGLRAGDNAAVAELFQRYFTRLLGLAEQRLGRRYHGPGDPADAVRSALNTFVIHFRDGEFRLDSDNELKNLLFKITRYKCLTLLEKLAAARRDPGRVADGADLTALLSREPTADAVAEFHELLNRLDAAVRDWPTLDQQVVERALAGEKPRDTADALGVPEGQVYRVRDRLKRLLNSFRREP